jgi:2-polyprenyl-3-methyl-5-hydroxy-6-metoxy-1,4-benzoquinol methylase
MSDSKALWIGIDGDIRAEAVSLGRYTSDDYINDPKHVAFVASRYKFVAKMLDGLGTVLEIGCGDGFGAPFVASAVSNLICTDINEPLLADIRKRHTRLKNARFDYFDFRAKPYSPAVDGAYLVDVIEHIYAAEEANFVGNIVGSLQDRGVLLIGTPNKTADQYASEWSRKAHVNLKTHKELRELGLKHFHNVFMFGMNDEVVHTGYGPMCHFLWALCVGPRR